MTDTSKRFVYHTTRWDAEKEKQVDAKYHLKVDADGYVIAVPAEEVLDSERASE